MTILTELDFNKELYNANPEWYIEDKQYYMAGKDAAEKGLDRDEMVKSLKERQRGMFDMGYSYVSAIKH